MTLSATQLVVKVNRAALQMLGYKAADQLVGRHISEVIRCPLNGHIMQAFAQLIESKAT